MPFEQKGQTMTYTEDNWLMHRAGPNTPPAPQPRETGQLKDDYRPSGDPTDPTDPTDPAYWMVRSDPIDGLDRLRRVLKTLTEEEWSELARQMYPVGTPPPRMFSRAALAAWLKTWMHRS